MVSVLIVQDDSLRATPGSFGARLQGDELHVPRDIAQILKECGIATVEKFLGLAATFPLIFTSPLGWTEEQVRTAREAVATLCRQGKDPQPSGSLHSIARLPRKVDWDALAPASVCFIHEAEGFLQRPESMTQDQREALRAQVDDLKYGRKTLNAYLPVTDFLYAVLLDCAC